jgi:hypothetical protein
VRPLEICLLRDSVAASRGNGQCDGDNAKLRDELREVPGNPKHAAPPVVDNHAAIT